MPESISFFSSIITVKWIDCVTSDFADGNHRGQTRMQSIYLFCNKSRISVSSCTSAGGAGGSAGAAGFSSSFFLKELKDLMMEKSTSAVSRKVMIAWMKLPTSSCAEPTSMMMSVKLMRLLVFHRQCSCLDNPLKAYAVHI